MEKVRAASQGPVFYQLYLIGGRGAAEAAIERARVAGFSALVVTIDTPVAGLRERDFRNGMKELMGTNPVRQNSVSSADSLASGMVVEFLLDGGVPALPNVVIPGKGPMPLVDVAAPSPLPW